MALAQDGEDSVRSAERDDLSHLDFRVLASETEDDLDEEIEDWLRDGFEETEVPEREVDPEEAPPDEVDEAITREQPRRDVRGEGLWHFDARMGTDFPIDIGGKLVLETPARIRLHVGLGGLPEEFQGLANDVIVKAGGYDETIAQIVDDTLRAAFVLHTAIGLRPAKKKGFVFDVGYRMIMLTAQNTPTSVLTQASDVAVPASLRDFAGSELRLKSYIHQVTVRAGWEWLAAERLSIRLDVGGSFSLDTSHNLTSHSDEDVPADAQLYIEEAEAVLDSMFRRWGHLPTVGLSFGYRFF